MKYVNEKPKTKEDYINLINQVVELVKKLNEMYLETAKSNKNDLKIEPSDVLKILKKSN